MNSKKIVATTIVCGFWMVTLLNSPCCFSKEGTVTAESKGKTQSESLLDRINVADELYKQGLNYAQYGLFDEAIEMYKKALTRNPSYPDVYNKLGVAYAQKGMYDNAIEAFQRLLNKSPKTPKRITILVRRILIKVSLIALLRHFRKLSNLNQRIGLHILSWVLLIQKLVSTMMQFRY
ncbi:MAG: tetratricopeptide repeat protein [Planctomycetia bacterium]|nr:tetratricopeptide repeat protein [Planctomycetia bacterium]